MSFAFKRFSSFALLLSCAAVLVLPACDDSSVGDESEKVAAYPGLSEMEGDYPFKTLSGSYLASRHAQNNFDWGRAEMFLGDVLQNDVTSPELRLRGMMVALTAGDNDKAIKLSHELVQGEAPPTLPQLMLILEQFKQGKMDDVLKAQIIGDKDAVSDYVLPLVKAWAAAAKGKTEVADLQKNAVHIYNAFLIADMNGDKLALKNLAARPLANYGISAVRLERLANLLAKNGLVQDADKLKALLAKAGMVDEGEDTPPAEKLTPQTGLAKGLLDLAGILYERFPESAMLFLQMALYIDPVQPEAQLMRAAIAGEFGLYDDAAKLYQVIDTRSDKALSLKTRRLMADTLEKGGRVEDAVRVLEKLVEDFKDAKTQVQIGDVYRRAEDYKKALSAYNKAADMVEDKKGVVPKEYWSLLYARGMTQERLKNWDEAEKDLKAALAYEPEHPYILNYLGYSYIDQDIKLDEAAKMIEKAVSLRPNDGYIVDSLGWVYYKRKEFAKAAEVLEKAIELMPYDATVNDHLGDAYWQVGRKSEAEFQWKRALSLVEEKDAELKIKIEQKLATGLAE